MLWVLSPGGCMPWELSPGSVPTHLLLVLWWMISYSDWRKEAVRLGLAYCIVSGNPEKTTQTENLSERHIISDCYDYKHVTVGLSKEKLYIRMHVGIGFDHLPSRQTISFWFGSGKYPGRHFTSIMVPCATAMLALAVPPPKRFNFPKANEAGTTHFFLKTIIFLSTT